MSLIQHASGSKAGLPVTQEKPLLQRRKLSNSGGTTASAVRVANDIPRGMKPMAGSALLLPIAAPAGSQTRADLVASASLQTTLDIIKVYTQAKPRETLADVARRSTVTLNQLAQWNTIAVKRANQRLSPGKGLTLWVQRERAPCFLSALPTARVSHHHHTTQRTASAAAIVGARNGRQ